MTQSEALAAMVERWRGRSYAFKTPADCADELTAQLSEAATARGAQLPENERKFSAFVGELRTLLEGSGKIMSHEHNARLWGVLVGLEQLAAPATAQFSEEQVRLLAKQFRENEAENPWYGEEIARAIESALLRSQLKGDSK